MLSSYFLTSSLTSSPLTIVWVRNYSNYTLCHKGTGEPTQALLWLVGHIDTQSLLHSGQYESWSVTIRLPPASDSALNAFWKSGPFKGGPYVSPNRFALAKCKTSLKKVVEDLAEMGEEEPVVQLVADLPYPFTYDGTSLTADWVLPDQSFDVANFKTGSSVGVEYWRTAWVRRTRVIPWACAGFTISPTRRSTPVSL